MNDGRRIPERRIEHLALTFPCLRGKAGIAPWDANCLDSWAASGHPSHGEKCTAKFILAVWNPDHDWCSGRFDLMESVRVWDEPSRKAFLAWANEPWWC